MNGVLEWKVVRDPAGDGYLASLRFPAGSGPASVVTGGIDERQAVARAAALANQLVQSPVFRAVAPPGTAAAIRAVSYLAKSQDVRHALTKFVGPGARRLAHVFGF